MRQTRPSPLPLLLGLVLPWQTVFIFQKINEFTTIQFFAWQAVILCGWAWRGYPGWRLLLKGLLPLVALSLTSAFPAFSLWHVFTVGIGGALYFLVNTFEPTEKISWWWGLALGAIPLVILSLWQVITGGSGSAVILGLSERSADRLGESVVIFQGERVLRAYGSLAHPNILAAWAIAVAAVSFSLGTPWSKRLLIFSLILLSLTFSRSGLLATLILFVLIYSPKYTWRVAWGLCLVAFSLTFIAPRLAASLRGGGALEERSLSERQSQMTETARLLSHPKIFLLGTGPGTSTATRAILEPGLPTYAYQPVHNTFALMLLEVGTPLCLFSLFYFIYKRPSLSPTLALTLPFLFFDHFLWTMAVGPVILAVLSTLDWRLLKGKIEP